MRKEDKILHNLTEAKADIEKFKSWLNDDDLFDLYYKLAPRLKSPYKDIYWIMRNSTKEDLKAYLDQLNSTKSKSEIKREDLEGAKLVSENSSYKCYHITSYKASVIMGRGAKWCISMKDDPDYWKSYTAKGIKFYFFIGKNEKLALALYPKKITVNITDIDVDSEPGKIITNFELFNEEDENISYKISVYNLPQIPGVELVYIDSLENLDENGLYIDNNVVLDADRNLTQVTIPEGVVGIGDSAFSYCYFLENVKLPNSLLSIDKKAFYNCNNLESVVIPDSVKKIGYYAFYDCSSLTNVVIPNSVTDIDAGAFNSCSSLTDINIPDSVTTIENSAFSYCSNLKSVRIPNNLKIIELRLFRGCSNLTNIEIPNSVTTIKGYAFSNCIRLKSIVIPSSVTTIGSDAFYGSNNLTIYCEATSQPSGWSSYWNSSRPVVWGYKGDKLEEDKETPNISFDNFIKDAGIILVDNAFDFDINEWGEENQKEIDEELGESSDVSLKKPQFIKYKLTSDRIKQVIDKIIVSDFNIVNYWETNQFKKKNNLIDEDLKNILRTLTVKDYETNSKDVDGKYNEAIIFIKNANIKNIKNIELYIKLDYDTVEDSPVIVISFHSRSTHPIKNNLAGSKDKEDGYKILEDINEEELSKIESLINDLYELRKTSIEEGGEYSIGNLIFKEFRNKGYLDNLKDRMRELINKELSLEETKKRKKKKGISNGEMGWFTKFNTGNVPFNIGFFNMVASGNFGDSGEISGDVSGDASVGSVAVGESLKGKNKKCYLKESMFDDKAYEYIYNYLEENYDGDDLEDSTKTILEYFINVYPESINYIDYWGKDKKTIEEIETKYSNKYITDLLSSEGFPNKLIDDYVRNYSLDLKKREGDK